MYNAVGSYVNNKEANIAPCSTPTSELHKGKMTQYVSLDYVCLLCSIIYDDKYCN